MSADELPNGFASMNDAADFWRYTIGVNVIPADTKNKVTYTHWIPYQDNPISEEQHNEWKTSDEFEDGMGIILGKVWHNPQKIGLYANAIDADNLTAVNEACNYQGKQISVQQLASWTLVEQHLDAPDKMHVIVYSKKPFLTKGSDAGNPKLSKKIEADEIPAFEVKSVRTMLFVSPSPHKDEHRYEIIGTKEPVIAGNFEQHIDDICHKYGIPYLEADNGEGKAQIPRQDLFEEDFEIYEGHNRSQALMRIMEILLKRNKNILSYEEIRDYARRWNNRCCKPPLDSVKFETQWKCALDFITKKEAEEEALKQYYQKTQEEVDKMSTDEKIEYLLGSINTVHPKEMIEQFHFKCLTDTRELYYYDKTQGAYLPDGDIQIEKELEADYISNSKKYAKVVTILKSLSEEEIKALSETGVLKVIGRKMPDAWSRHDINEFQGHIERYPGVFMQRNKFNPDIEWLASENCMINLLTGETAQFDPKFLNTTQIPVIYTGDQYYASGPIVDFWNWVKEEVPPVLSPCPRIMKFMHEVMNKDDVDYILDFIAYCLWRDLPSHMFVLFKGDGSNGKGTLMHVIIAVLGNNNVSGESLHTLSDENNRFARAQLFNKLANIDADLSSEALESTGTLKKLTGRDKIRAEEKFRKPFDFINHAKLIFSANTIPQTPDETDAYFRRIKIIEFIKQFLGEDIDPLLKEKLTTKEELSGLLHVVLSRVPRIVKQGLTEITNESIAESYHKYTLLFYLPYSVYHDLKVWSIMFFCYHYFNAFINQLSNYYSKLARTKRWINTHGFLSILYNIQGYIPLSDIFLYFVKRKHFLLIQDRLTDTPEEMKGML